MPKKGEKGKQKTESSGRTIISIAGGGGATIVSLLLGNWLMGVAIALLVFFNDEAKLTGSYLVVVLLVVFCPAKSWQQKKQEIRHHAEFYVYVLKKSLVEKFLDREVI